MNTRLTCIRCINCLDIIGLSGAVTDCTDKREHVGQCLIYATIAVRGIQSYMEDTYNEMFH